VECDLQAALTEEPRPGAGRKLTGKQEALLVATLLGGADPKTAFDPNGLLDDLKKALAERALNAEMDHHLANGEAGIYRAIDAASGEAALAAFEASPWGRK
jgi:hypothetical protein